MSESLKLYKNESKHEEDKKELFEDMGSVASNNNPQREMNETILSLDEA